MAAGKLGVQRPCATETGRRSRLVRNGEGSKDNEVVGVAPKGATKALGKAFETFRFSYVARIINCLEGMNEDVREGLGLILEVSVRQGSKVCRVFGLWSESEVVDGPLYLVCEKHHGGSLLDKFSELRNGFVGTNGDRGGFLGFAIIGKGICESVHALHLEGLLIRMRYW
ncbi:hypothetical protein SESBI_29820 [Sesbania bispinosa]|nr:hypothetical protein SESBI_29820 [Sesbania bispinosa]